MPKSGKPSAAYSGTAETFQDDRTGTFTDSSFPTGWLDLAVTAHDPDAPEPSAVVIKTTDAYGHLTKAVASLPAGAGIQGIYRPIDVADTYRTQADVRIDRFGTYDPSGAVEDPNNHGFLLCGCPVGSEAFLDWPMSVGFLDLATPTSDPTHAPIIAMVASTLTGTWQLFAATDHVFAAADTHISVQEGKWYGVEVDFNAPDGILHGVITDKTTGATLAAPSLFLKSPSYGHYTLADDGVFNVEAFIDTELTQAFGTGTHNIPGLGVVDNIDTISRSQGNAHAFAYGHDHGSNASLVNCIMPDHG
jgi:hypothetical protein